MTLPDASRPQPALKIDVYATLRDLPPLVFPHELMDSRDLSDPALRTQLRGLGHYIMTHGAGGPMQAQRYHLWRHVQRVWHNVRLEVDVQDMAALSAWALAANAVLVMPDITICTPDLTIIMAPDGTINEAAQLPYPPDAIARRQRSLDALAGLALAALPIMPPVLGEGEVVFRDVAEMEHRLLGLFRVGAEGVALCGTPDNILSETCRTLPIDASILTPQEKAFIDAPTPVMAEQMSWRVEAASTLAWALSPSSVSLGPAEGALDVDNLVHVRKAIGAGERLALRPAGEILDLLDMTWRQHWITRQAGGAACGFSPDIMMERHAALNWLTGFDNMPDTAWDEIATPT
ncbi:DUF4272 domain-containing protein [Komagataeibacter xylinus]|uniref:DUF4272 domain-containing protein n=1 Tax=Komagataeibacter xylinus TaxID=28448 RepID=UPI00280BB26D|nr:DUF4272 domain-containing protein [Komagataeibacter xylinus]